MALAVVDIVDCQQAPNYEPEAANRRARYAWVLANPRPIEPFPVKGKLGLFDVPFDIPRAVVE